MAGKFYKLEEDGSILCNTTQECPDEVVDQVGNDIVDTGTTVVTTNKFLIPPSCRKTTLCRSSAAHPGVFKDKLYSNLSKTTPFNLKDQFENALRSAVSEPGAAETDGTSPEY